jgi:hypothetical protein
MDWLLRPVLKGALRYESLLDGTVGLADVALLNDAYDVQADNEVKASRLNESK